MTRKKLLAVCLILLAAGQIAWIFLTPVRSPLAPLSPPRAPTTTVVVSSEIASPAEAPPASNRESTEHPVASRLEIEQLTRETVVEVSQSDAEAVGTGFIARLNSDGFDVMTAAHILGIDEHLQITPKAIEVRSFFRSSTSQSDNGNDEVNDKHTAQHDATAAPTRTHSAVWLLGFDVANDLAVLRVVSSSLPTHRLVAAQTPPRPPFDAWQFVWDSSDLPSEQAVQVVDQRRARREAAGELVSFWVCERPSLAGMSGGPLLSMERELLGIASGNSTGQGFYSQTAAIQKLLDKTKL